MASTLPTELSPQSQSTDFEEEDGSCNMLSYHTMSYQGHLPPTRCIPADVGLDHWAGQSLSVSSTAKLLFSDSSAFDSFEDLYGVLSVHVYMHVYGSVCICVYTALKSIIRFTIYLHHDQMLKCI